MPHCPPRCPLPHPPSPARQAPCCCCCCCRCRCCCCCNSRDSRSSSVRPQPLLIPTELSCRDAQQQTAGAVWAGKKTTNTTAGAPAVFARPPGAAAWPSYRADAGQAPRAAAPARARRGQVRKRQAGPTSNTTQPNRSNRQPTRNQRSDQLGHRTARSASSTPLAQPQDPARARSAPLGRAAVGLPPLPATASRDSRSSSGLRLVSSTALGGGRRLLWLVGSSPTAPRLHTAGTRLQAG